MRKSKNNRKAVLLVLCVALVFYLGHLWGVHEQKIYRQYRQSILEENFNITIGSLHHVGKNGNSGPYIIAYQFKVNGKEYLRSEYSDYGGYYYSKCVGRMERCRDINFFVIYLPDDPEKSLADFSQVVPDIENPIFPKALENFK